jgi:ABC-type tungstate transport system substrate-binding protein
VTVVLAGFGRSISEIGAVLIVGANIAGYTRISVPRSQLLD